MKILIQIINIILAIILTLSISLLIFTNTATSTILSENYILGQLEKTEYYTKIQEEIKSSFENYIAQSGFDENVVENIVSEEKIKNDTQIIISNIYEGKEQEIETTEIEDNLKTNINKSLNNQKLSTTQQKAIEQYIETICNQYEETMTHTKYETSINSAINKINKYINMAKKAIMIAIAVLIVIILIMNCKAIFRGLAQIGIALTSTGIIYVIINLFINSKIKVQNIVILNNAISETVRITATDILNIIMKNGIIVLGCGIVMIFLSNIINNIILKKRNKENTESNY
jgi:hypothetical protein